MKKINSNNYLWWENKVGYQIYPRSFYDSNNDGNGDLAGITKKLPYLKKLGVKIIYISPIFKSPMYDNGYDVSDYLDINPLFGNMDDFSKLLKFAKKLSLSIILDIVPNHTSTEHKWFKKAIAGESKYQNYYLLTENPIENIKSVFGGKAWSKLSPKDKYYYLHTFAPQQADLNWNNPEVLKEFIKITNFWLNKGVKGFRFDVIDHIGQNKNFDCPENFLLFNQAKLHNLVKKWAKNSWKKYKSFTIGESWTRDLTSTINYTLKSNQEIDACFALTPTMYDYNGDVHMKKHSIDLVKFKASISRIQTEIIAGKGRVGLVLNNHDMPRQISRFGDDKKYRIESGKTLALTMFGLHGIPFIYQGDEIGMINARFKSLTEFNDVAIHQLYKSLENKNEKLFLKKIKWMNRDNARTPFQWNNKNNAGFNKSTKTWLKINENFKKINLENDLKEKSNSLFKWYQKIIKFRKNKKYQNLLINGSYELIDAKNRKLFIYKREYQNEKLLIIANWSNKLVKINFKIFKKNIILNSENIFKNNSLLPWQSIIFYQNVMN